MLSIFSFFGWLHLFNIILIFSLMWPPNDVVSHRRLYPAGIYLLKFNNRNTKTRCEICSKLTIKTPGAFIVNFEHLSHLNLVFLLLTLDSNFQLGSQVWFKPKQTSKLELKPLTVFNKIFILYVWQPFWIFVWPLSLTVSNTFPFRVIKQLTLHL